MGTGNQVGSSASATDSVPACRSTPSITQLSPPKDSATICSACGHDGEPFHRLKHDGTARHFCSSCILFLYKGMYCCLCFVVYETPAAKGDSSLWVSCAKCQRIGHIKCARDRDLHIDSAFFTCPKCSQPEKALAQSSCISTEGQARNGSPPLKRLRSSGDDQSACTTSLDDQQKVHGPPDEVLAAAQIVALLAVQHAKDAKARSRASAAAAARAAACAKVALDTAYRIAREEARWKPESSRRLSGVLPGNNAGLPSLSAISAPKNMRVDGGVPMRSPLLYSDGLSHKDQVGKGYTTAGYIPLNSRVTTQYNKMKILPPSPEATATLPRSGAFQKPQAVRVQEALESVHNGGPEVVNVSASPASILDAATSLDTPRPSSSVEPGPGEPDAASNASCSSTVLTRSDLPGNSAHLQTSKDQISTFDKKDQRFDDSARFVAKEVANSKPDTPLNCVIDVEGMEVGPKFSGEEKAAGDALGDVSKHTEQK